MTRASRASQEMDTLRTFAPNLEGPGSMRTGCCQIPSSDEGDHNVVADSERRPLRSSGRVSMPQPLLQSTACLAVCDESGLPGDLSTEFVIGVQECDTHDTVDRTAFSEEQGTRPRVG